MKRAGDKVDAGIAALLAFLGVLLYSARLWILWDTDLLKSFCKTALSFSGPKLACVPMECPTDPLNPNVRNMFYIIVVWQIATDNAKIYVYYQCALDWSHQSRLCEQELLFYPDASFHLLLLLKGALFLRSSHHHHHPSYTLNFLSNSPLHVRR